MKNIIRQTTSLALHIAEPYIGNGATVIDATCGNGHDTLALAQLLFKEGDEGRLLAFDIQERAILSAGNLLENSGFNGHIERKQIELILDSHENMNNYADEADLIFFNLGYLPGGDKTVTTAPHSTIKAVNRALSLLKRDGLISITMYSGHPSGAAEKKELLDFAQKLDSSKYHVAYINMVNQPNNPPEILVITKKHP